jgi:osmotically-inducible protein OsmY
MSKISACTSLVALGGLSLLAGCAIDRTKEDDRLTSNVQSMLNEHPEIGNEVSVQTVNHVVYLSGFVSAGEMRTVAESVANGTPGVSRVVDTIAVTK